MKAAEYFAPAHRLVVLHEIRSDATLHKIGALIRLHEGAAIVPKHLAINNDDVLNVALYESEVPIRNALAHFPFVSHDFLSIARHPATSSC
jgi:hypothetical protein